MAKDGSIYVHFPFCKRKCLYCAFYSVAGTKWREPYWNALCKEIQLTKDYLPTRQIGTLYFGGGTPSLCSVKELERVIDQIHKFYDFSENLEFTLEGNPEQLSYSYLRDIKQLGINRLSVGVQSFNDEILKLLKRGHTAAEARAAVENAVAAGFDNISVDLIYDIAYRTREMWKQDLQTALSLPIMHLSAYSLTVEENTLLARQVREGKPFLPNDCDTERDYAILMEQTAKAGFEQYEISNFAKNGAVSRHNSAYWTGQPYLGLGPAAHSFNSPVRKWNIADLQQYIEGIQSGNLAFEEETLTLKMQYNEYVLLRLRTKNGINLAEVERLFGKAYLGLLLKQLKNVNPMHYGNENGRIVLTYEGKLFADAVSAELFA